jgi:hypothetical protein
MDRIHPLGSLYYGWDYAAMTRDRLFPAARDSVVDRPTGRYSKTASIPVFALSRTECYARRGERTGFTQWMMHASCCAEIVIGS